MLGAQETLWHRMWVCHRWCAQRAAAGLPLEPPAQVWIGLLATGALPMDDEAWVARQRQWEAVQTPAAGVTGVTDGNVVDGRDPLLAHAACASVLVDAGGHVVRLACGAVASPQTALRAQLAAAIWVTDGSAGLAPIVTDCDYERAEFRLIDLRADHGRRA